MSDKCFRQLNRSPSSALKQLAIIPFFKWEILKHKTFPKKELSTLSANFEQDLNDFADMKNRKNQRKK